MSKGQNGSYRISRDAACGYCRAPVSDHAGDTGLICLQRLSTSISSTASQTAPEKCPNGDPCPNEAQGVECGHCLWHERIWATERTWSDDPTGLPIGLNDSNGHPIHIGDVLDFDAAEWGEPMRFTVELVNGEIRHPGATGDLVEWCKVVRCVRTAESPEKDIASAIRAAPDYQAGVKAAIQVVRGCSVDHSLPGRTIGYKRAVLTALESLLSTGGDQNG